MPEDADHDLPIACFRAPDGALVGEVDLTDGHHGVAEGLILRARALGVDKLWVHAHVVDVGLGFVRRGGHTRLIATRPPAAIELASPPSRRIREIQRACFGDVWGRQDPGPPDPSSVFVALHERGDWVGICEVDPETQWIDGPGVVPSLRTPDRYARLVQGAAAHLRDEPVVLDTWGDDPSTLAAYAALGFAVMHSVSGWELDFSGSR